jgi:hypothetical protein
MNKITKTTMAIFFSLVMLLLLTAMPAYATTDDNINVEVEAVVTKVPGNTNILTITVKDGNSIYTEEFLIQNNSDGHFDVSDYTVYVSTYGNDKILQCYIVPPSSDLDYFPDGSLEIYMIMALADELREMKANGATFEEMDQRVVDVVENPRTRGNISNYITGKLNSQEQTLYNNNKAKGLLCMANGKLAIQYSEEWYTAASLYNGNGDAFRHILWNFGMTIDVGATFAKQWSDAHENGTANNPALEKQMDLHNNAIGIQLGKDNPTTLLHSTFKSKSRDKVRNGSARIISGGKLVASGYAGEK